MRSRRHRLWLLLALVGACLAWGAAPVASAPEARAVRFSAAGDFSSSTAASSVFTAIGALGNDLHLALGDMSYGATGAEGRWCDLVKQGVGEGYPFQLVAGNHESNGQNGNINDFSACLPNQLPKVSGTYGRQYHVDVPAHAPLVRFVLISPNLHFPGGTWSYAAGSSRYEWTAAAIDGARAAKIPWVVVGMHKVCLSMGDYGCDVGPDLMNLLVDRRVDLVLSGDEHLYQRSSQLRTGPTCPELVPGTYTAACVADSDADLVAGQGTVFTTVGTGGIALRKVNRADPEARYFVAASGANADPTFGVLDVRATATTLSASFRRAAGGTFRDAFSLTKGAPVPSNTPPVASFTSSCPRLTCTFDARATVDPDGRIAAYEWDFGDGATSVDAATTRTYGSGGSYPVRLWVTDDGGATSGTRKDVTAPGWLRLLYSPWGAQHLGGVGHRGSGAARR